MAERQGIPPKYIPQLAALLSRMGWVASARGAGGGIRLVADPHSITVRDVIEAGGGSLAIKPCASAGHPCERRDRCPLYPVWMKAQAAVERIVGDATLADLLGSSDARAT